MFRTDKIDKEKMVFLQKDGKEGHLLSQNVKTTNTLGLMRCLIEKFGWVSLFSPFLLIFIHF